MKLKFLFVIAILIGLSLGVRAASGDPENEFTVKTYTLKELRAAYGSNLVLPQDVVIDESTEISFVTAANPCAGTGFELCGPAEAHARAYARTQANSCCCVFTYGWECCDPATGSLTAALFITLPRNNCE